MDHQPELKAAIIKLRDSLRNFAKARGWSPENYRILMTVHELWGAITVVFFSDKFERISSSKIKDEMLFYDEIMDQLESDLAADPGLYEATGLLLSPMEEYFTWGYRGQTANILEIDDGLLNPEIPREQLRGPIGSHL